ncbi:hypothetical protein H0266_00365 [Halobacillus locisalis]|uniref:Sporulation membrane protein YtrI C-terminal domain-containing protein n=1 Tax=Halobacillus locisalis TaxID=220753 RepID=A0A838CMZ1_9BACI|nr:sporulation membrane protein YtrI [Halobacillus locisalis]MBA2173344.1 hypothetical protein [Halobacillus locisalis]
MHIPPLYKKKEWKRFFAGLSLGAIIGYMFFLFIYGQQQENITKEHIQLTAEFNELEDKYEHLLNNPKKGKEAEPTKVNEVVVNYANAKKLEVDLLTQHQLTSLVKELLASIHGQDLNTISTQVDLIISTVESKDYVIDQMTYQLEVRKLIVAKEVTLDLEIKLVP